jgi:hypothetical protein
MLLGNFRKGKFRVNFPHCALLVIQSRYGLWYSAIAAKRYLPMPLLELDLRMAQKIARYDASFTGINVPITLNIPQGSDEVAIRVYTDQKLLSIFVLQDILIPPGPTYSRTFELILDGQPNPPNYKKYLATIPFGPGNAQTHLIEIGSPVPGQLKKIAIIFG